MTHLLQPYDVSIGLLAAVGLVYLAYSQRFIVGYRRFFYLLIAGLLVFSVGGPLADLYAPDYLHLVHGLAALLVVFGLYDPVHNDLRTDEWARLLVREPSELRHPGGWMVPMDDRILELFHSSDLVLTPAIIAYNIEHSREEVNRRLTALEAHGLVQRPERGKYRITQIGEQYLHGELATNSQKTPD